jgi:hypothetical protein
VCAQRRLRVVARRQAADSNDEGAIVRTRRLFAVWVIGFVLAPGGALAEAQQRPLQTEDPESIGSGLILIESGVDFLRGQSFPVTGLKGNLWLAPTLGLNFGMSSIAELQLDASLMHLKVTERMAAPHPAFLNFEGDRTYSPGDIHVATKVRFLSEGLRRPGMGLRFATRLPNASRASGLGVETMDFLFTVLVAKTIESVRVVGNFGLGILGDTARADLQNDVVVYGVSIARAFAQGAEIVGEINGRANTRRDEPTPGTENLGQIRVGARYTRGTVRVDGAIITGLTSRDTNAGFTAGLTWVFRGFTVPP